MEDPHISAEALRLIQYAHFLVVGLFMYEVGDEQSRFLDVEELALLTDRDDLAPPPSPSDLSLLLW